jgi:peptidyl-prolyl cis-trans isomerase D
MLRSLRKSAGTWFVRVFLGLLALLFGIGIWSDPGSMLRSRSGSVIASVGEATIDPQAFTQEFQRDANRARASLGDAFDEDATLKAQVARATIDRMAMGLQFAQEAERLGLAVSDEAIARAIVDNPAFHDEAGAFSRDIFIGRIANQGFSEPAFVALVRQEALRAQIAGAFAGAAGAPEALVDRLFAYQNETRVAEYVLVEANAMTPAREPTEADLEAFYDAHPERYTAPEYRSGSVVRIDPAELAPEVALDENEVIALYEERAPALSSPERRTLEQILLPDEAGAKAAKARLDGGEDFLAVAASLGQGGSAALGAMTRGDLFAPELAEAAFGAAQGAVTAPVQSPLGWHLFRVVAIEPAHEVGLEEARPAIEAELRLQHAADAAYEMANTLEDALAGGATLAEAADQLDLPLVAVPPVDASGAAPNGTSPEAADADVVGTLFETPEGEVSPLQETAEGGFFVVVTERVQPSALRPLEEVRADLEVAWRGAERDRLAAEAVSAASIELAAGTPLAEIAARLGTEVRTTAPFRRIDGPAEAPFPPDLVESLFAVGVGDLATGAADDGSGHILARLARIDAADKTKDARAYADLEAAVAGQIRADMLEQYRATLQRRYPVEFDPAVLDALL